MPKYVTFFDFDNTITRRDVLDDILARFSVNGRWIELERRWKRGDIGSKECLEGQIGGIRMTKGMLDRYIKEIDIDPHFKKLLRFFASKNIKPVIVSDNFDYILENTMKNHGINGVKTYCNRLKVDKDRLIPRFPLTNAKCGNCGHCKKTTVLKHTGKGVRSAYVGDGLSDLHASKCADIVFAKDTLLKYCREEGMDCVPFKDFRGVHDYFKALK
ncbi:MAG: MtnX-like HAD-IB family phosphatase [Candidatus Omnitrophota bacterium]